MNGCSLSLATLAIIADALERNGDVRIKNVATDQTTPTVTALGFEIVHGAEPSQYLTQAVPLAAPKEDHV
jgi:hypothetical protein